MGENTGAAVLQLVDLIAALRTTDALLAGEPISCSIDPTPASLQRLAHLTHGGRATPSAHLLKQMEEAVGPQAITLTGISPNSHFAQILVAADWHMKHLAMGLAPSPVDGPRPLAGPPPRHAAKRHAPLVDRLRPRACPP